VQAEFAYHFGLSTGGRTMPEATVEVAPSPSGRKRRRENQAFVSIGIALVMELAMLSVHSAHAETSAPAAGAGLSQTGARLQADITATYEELRQNQTLRFAPEGGNDVTTVVLKYIPLGASLDDATAILRAAGYYLTTTPDGVLYARANLGGGFPSFKPSGLEIVLRSGPINPHTLTQLHAEIFRKPNGGDRK
jgi:hypothetical protein